MKPLFGLDQPITVNYNNTYNLAIKNNLKALQFSIDKYAGIRDMIAMRNRPTNGIYTCIHGNVTYNLAGSAAGTHDPQYYRKLNNTKAGLLTELDISTIMNIPLIVHIGYQHDKDVGVKTIINTINEVISMEGATTLNYAKLTDIQLTDFQHKRQLILENSAGKGSALGMTLDEISIILSGINPDYKDNVNVCIDTCHLSDAGQYRLGDPSQVESFFSDFDQKIGLNKLKVMHLNDSKNAFGSCCDRHEHLGYGHIYHHGGLLGLQKILEYSSKLGVPLVGEFNDGNGMQDVTLVNSLI
jgi:endonuclease IV